MKGTTHLLSSLCKFDDRQSGITSVTVVVRETANDFLACDRNLESSARLLGLDQIPSETSIRFDCEEGIEPLRASAQDRCLFVSSVGDVRHTRA